MEKKLDELIRELEYDLIAYRNGALMSIAESIHGESITKTFLKKVKEIRDEKFEEEEEEE